MQEQNGTYQELGGAQYANTGVGYILLQQNWQLDTWHAYGTNGEEEEEEEEESSSLHQIVSKWEMVLCRVLLLCNTWHHIPVS
jgi:hypothetical protein